MDEYWMQGTIATVKRLRSSEYGNPRFEFTFDDGRTVKTEPNTMMAYAVTEGWSGRMVAFQLNGRRNVVKHEFQDSCEDPSGCERQIDPDAVDERRCYVHKRR